MLEHQDAPVGFLEAIKKMLRPGGWIAGSVPNRESWWIVNISRKLYPKFDFPPHHFVRFSKKSLAYALKKVGFQTGQIEDTPLKVGYIASELRL